MQKIINAIFLVSGTSIGAGMIAQPSVSSQLGFMPAVVMLVLAWLFMTTTALLIAEASMVLGSDVHMSSIAQEFLGKWGKLVAVTTYLFIIYLTNIAYVYGGQDLLLKLTALDIPEWLAAAFFVFGLGLVLLFKSKTVGFVNSFFFALLVAIYILILFSGSFGVDTTNLFATMNWHKSYTVVPLFLTSFSFQMIVPNISSYLKYDRRSIYIAIIGGTATSLSLYVLWNFVILGSLDVEATKILAQVYAAGSFPGNELAVAGLDIYKKSILYFSIFALITSFIGLSWGLLGFLADSLKIKAKGSGFLFLWCLVLFPPLLISQIWQGQNFIGALELTGGYGDAILNGIIPALVIAVALKTKRIKTRLSPLFYNSLLMVVILCSLGSLCLQFMLQFKLIAS